jgi:pimeloyl-ACP methyl ester carboxylesterase
MAATDQLFTRLARSRYRLSAGETLPDGTVWYTLNDEDTVIAAVAFSSDAFIMPLPSGTQEVVLDSTASSPTDRERDDTVRAALTSLVDGPVSRHVMWRLYLGSNTVRVDGQSTGSDWKHRIALPATRVVGILVGRIIYTIPVRARTFMGDPFAEKRRFEYEAKDRSIAKECPPVERVTRPVSVAVVAVHGTMACSVPLARFLRACTRPGTPVIRFEHDTWVRIDDNAQRLALELRRLRVQQVLLVGHSRGGLVARHTAQVLRRDGAKIDVSVLSLGTPFLGTPIIRGVERGLLGVRALLGGLRVAASSPAVDASTRLLGWMVAGRLPPGIAAMAEDSEYLSTSALFDVPVRKVAGHIVDYAGPDSYGLSFLTKFSAQAFAETPHDLVVGEPSAFAGDAHGSRVESDHFSFSLCPEVIQGVREMTSALRSDFIQLESEPDVTETFEW